MKRFAIAAALAALISTQAVAAKFVMQLQPAPDQMSRMNAGVAAVDSHRPKSSVRVIQTDGDLKKRGVIQLMMMNHGDTPFNFGPENVTAILLDGTPVSIIRPDQLDREEKSRQTWRRIGAALAAAVNSSDAAYEGSSTGFVSYSGSTSGMVGPLPVNTMTSGTAMITIEDKAAEQAAEARADAENRALFARVAERNAAGMQTLDAYMRTTTVDPQQMFGGSVMFELPKSVHKMQGDVPISFVVTVKSEQHKFHALLKRQ